MVMTTVGGCTACQVPKVRKTTRDFDHFTIDVDGLYEIRGVDVATASPTKSYDSSLDADGKPDEDYLGGVDSQSAALVEESDSELDAEGEDFDSDSAASTVPVGSMVVMTATVVATRVLARRLTATRRLPTRRQAMMVVPTRVLAMMVMPTSVVTTGILVMRSLKRV